MSNPDEKPAPRRPASGESIQAKPALSISRDEPEFTSDESSTASPVTPITVSPLVDREIFERVSFPVWPIIYLALALASFWFVYDRNWLATAILAPIGAALAAVYSYDYFRPARFRVSDEGLTSSRPRMFVPFEEFRDVAAGKANYRGEFPINIVFSGGWLKLPRRLTCDAGELLGLLRSRVPRAGELPPTPPLFDAFLKQQLMIYPIEQIHVFRGTFKVKRPTATRSILKFTIALLLPIPLWIGLAIANPRSDVFPTMAGLFGAFAFVFGLIAVATAFSKPRRGRNLNAAVLILTPGGLALNQVDLRGELRWSEVQKLRHKSSSSGSFQWSSQSAGIVLRVQGAEIVIADIYDWPIEAIIPIVRRYSGL